MSEWQPIDTAPKDGIEVILYQKCVFSGWWCSEKGAWITGETDCYGDPYEYQPTHWMPLPTPPLTPTAD